MSDIVALPADLQAIVDAWDDLGEAIKARVEKSGRELVLVAEVGDGYPVDQMPPEDGDLLDGRIVLARLSHRRNSSRVLL
jgi:hypothetical protein